MNGYSLVPPMQIGWVGLVFVGLFGGSLFAQSSINNETYPVASSKKGLQVEQVDDALALGIKHAALNLNLARMIDPQSTGENLRQPSWESGGRTFWFCADYVESLDRQIKPLSDAGVIVNLILLVYESKDETVNRIMLHPNYDRNAPNKLSAFNSQTEEGKQWLAATIEFLANRWSRDDQKFGRVWGYIVGNEVNSHWWWSNLGRASMQEFTDQYLIVLRTVHQSVRRHSASARVYVSLEHHWSMRYPAGDEQQAFPAKAFLDYLTQQSRDSVAGDFDWQVAFHPYPENLMQPEFWHDQTAVDQPDSPRVTFKNLSVLTDYLQTEPLLYQGLVRRVILSEQGFHTPDGPDGETIQAAAFCYAYKIVESNPEVDAFILHRHIDHPREGGLRLGLRVNQPGALVPNRAKKIYDCFRDADTADWESAFAFALPIIGLERW